MKSYGMWFTSLGPVVAKLVSKGNVTGRARRKAKRH